MAATIDVPDGVLAAAKVAWDDAADGLDGGWRRLSKSSVDGFSPVVAAAVGVFQDTWVDELKLRAREAQDYSDAFVEVAGAFTFADRGSADQARSLLDWTHRAAVIEVQ